MKLKHLSRKIVIWTVLILFVLVTVAAGLYIHQLNASKNALADAIQKSPATSAVVAYTVDAQGEIIEDGQSIFYNADTPLVVASTMKLIVLAAYEHAAAQAALDPNQQIPLADLERFYLPGTDGSAHSMGLASLGLSTDTLGFATNPQASIKLDDIARIMVSYSGNAETDYLINRLGADKIAAAMQAAGFEQHTPIFATLGIPLAMLNHENPLTTAGQFAPLVQAAARQDFSVMDGLAKRYTNDKQWRAAQIAWMKSPEFAASAAKLDWNAQMQASQLLPKGTAREYARLMAKIASGTLISPQVSTQMQQKLEAVPTDWPLRLIFHRRYGAKDGLTAGVITLASYAVPMRGPLAGHTRVVVELINQLPAEIWSVQARDQGIYLLQTDIASATGAFRSLADKQSTQAAP